MVALGDKIGPERPIIRWLSVYSSRGYGGMPKRSNEFQRLVYLVRVNLAAGATVTESKMLRDRSTGLEREVDVCVEGNVGGTTVNVCLECRDHARPADIS